MIIFYEKKKKTNSLFNLSLLNIYIYIIKENNRKQERKKGKKKKVFMWRGSLHPCATVEMCSFKENR